MAGPPWRSVAALVDPVRRALYDYVRHQDHPVTREEAAQAQAISRNLTAFHLDKLVEANLLRARYEAPAISPRPRGRAPKVYEPVGDGLALTVPPRRYDVVGTILADAVAEQPTNAAEAAGRLAFDHGQRMATDWLPTGVSESDPLTRVAAALTELGFEPRRESGPSLSLRNCPFHRLAARQPELVCKLNEAFIRGVLAGLDVVGLTAALQPRADTCCVVVRADG